MLPWKMTVQRVEPGTDESGGVVGSLKQSPGFKKKIPFGYDPETPGIMRQKKKKFSMFRAGMDLDITPDEKFDVGGSE